MVSFTLKVILHVAQKDSKYRDVAPLIYRTAIYRTAIFIAWAENGRQWLLRLNINEDPHRQITSNKFLTRLTRFLPQSQLSPALAFFVNTDGIFLRAMSIMQALYKGIVWINQVVQQLMPSFFDLSIRMISMISQSSLQ